MIRLLFIFCANFLIIFAKLTETITDLESQFNLQTNHEHAKYVFFVIKNIGEKNTIYSWANFYFDVDALVPLPDLAPRACFSCRRRRERAM